MDALITTVLPTYRRPALLQRAVLSILNQSRQDFVIQILDNASGDETEAVVRELMHTDARIRYHRQPENVGAIRNIISGLDFVQTRYFNILCDDDALMPEFFATTVGIHEATEPSAAFVATRVAVLDDVGAVSTPFPHPAGRIQLSSLDGIVRCIRAGVSLPGVMYRTSVMQQVGAPRTAWWNWTESGWHALAACRAPIEFSPQVGAIMYDHPAGGSKQMDGMEFRISRFKMLADVREAAMRSGISYRDWNRAFRTLLYALYASACLRFSRDRETDRDADLQLRDAGISLGLNAAAATALVRAAQAVRQIGAGGALNGAIDRALRGRYNRFSLTVYPRAASPTRRHPTPTDAGLDSALHVLQQLNEQSGVVPRRVH